MRKYLFICLVSFAGATWNLRPNVQKFQTDTTFDYHDTDSLAIKTAARRFGAFKKAMHSLEAYYNTDEYRQDSTAGPSATQSQLFPYRTHFISGDIRHDFVYVTQLVLDRLIFAGSCLTAKKSVKFVQRYSPDVHRYCWSIGVAPELLGFEKLDGGWYMVVMAMLGEGYVMLDQEPDAVKVVSKGIRECLIHLHQEKKYVHGDIRAVNIMVKNKAEFMIIDFYWAGEIDVVRYPMDVYSGRSFWRPEEVRGGDLIAADHDIKMLDYIVDSYSDGDSCMVVDS